MVERATKDLILWFFLGLFLVSMVLLGWLLWPFVSVIVLGAVVTGIFSPVYQMLTRTMRPSLSSFLTCLLVFLVLFIPIIFFVSILSKEAYDQYLLAKSAVLSDEIKTLFEGSRINDILEKNWALAKVKEFLENFGIELTGREFYQSISEFAKKIAFGLYEQASAIASNIFKFLFNFFFMLLVIYYLLIDGGKLLVFIIELSPLPNDQDEILIRKFKDMSGAILIGNGLGGVIQGTIGGVVFALFGLNSPFLWGVVMALLAFLPIVGIGAVFIPAAIFLFLKGRIAAGLFFIVFYILLSGIVEYYFKPKLVGKRVKMHTLLVFLSIIGGLQLFGILGIIYGPLVVTGFLTLKDIYYQSYRQFVAPEETNDEHAALSLE